MIRIIWWALLGIFPLAFVCSSCVQGSQQGSIPGDPHSLPEEVVRAYVDAIMADDCESAASFVAPERREKGHARIMQECANQTAPFLVSASIEDISIEEWEGISIVTLYGDFYTDLGPESRRQAYNDQIVYSTERVDGKWYVKP